MDARHAAAQVWEALSSEDREYVGDVLVLGEDRFELKVWFHERFGLPLPKVKTFWVPFWRELDELRMQWETMT